MGDGNFGRYQLIEEVGHGGMGTVYKAHDSKMKRDVAIKVLPEILAAEPGYAERFRREAQAAGRLSEPHILPVYEAGELDGRLYLVMPFVNGRDLQRLLEQEGPMATERAVAIIEQIGTALDAATDAGLTHRDVKPSNILIASRDFAYLIDFGIAHDADSTRMTSTGTTIGTWGYMAPERFSPNTIADSRADVYSLACVLFECLTGRKPFPGQSLPQQVHGHCYDEPPKPTDVKSDCPSALDAVIARGMAKDPTQRYQTGAEIAAAARLALSDADGPVVHDSLQDANQAPTLQPTMPASIYRSELHGADTQIDGSNRTPNKEGNASIQPHTADVPDRVPLGSWFNQFPAQIQALASGALLVPTIVIYALVYALVEQSPIPRIHELPIALALCGLYFLATIPVVARTPTRITRALLFAVITLCAEALIGVTYTYQLMNDVSDGARTLPLVLITVIPFGYVASWGVARRQHQWWWKVGLPLSAFSWILRIFLFSEGWFSAWLAFPGVVAVGCFICWIVDRHGGRNELDAVLDAAGFTNPDDGTRETLDCAADAFDYLCEVKLVSQDRALSAVAERWPSVTNLDFIRDRR